MCGRARAANRFRFFIDPHLQPQFVAQLLHHVHAGKACADHDRIKVFN
jgi:hypothetical protein